MSYGIDAIKNVSIAGHGGTGKTTLFEHLLYAGGVIQKAEPVESGRTVSDSSLEEIERKISIHTALAYITRNGKKINFFDTPGSPDFTGDVILSFRACDIAALTVDGRSGVQIETIKLWRNLEEGQKPRGIFVTRLDEDRADFDKTLRDIKDKCKITPVPVALPMGAGAAYKGVIDVLNEKAYFVQGDGSALEKDGAIPAEYAEAVAEARERLIEAAADGDDTLMDRYLEKGSLDAEEMHRGLIEAIADHKYVPVFTGSAMKNSGLIPFLDFIADIAPCPKTAKDIVVDGEGNKRDISMDPSQPLAALVIKTTYDQFSGKLSWVKIINGTLSGDSEVYNVSENKKERIGKLFFCQGKRIEETSEIRTGDVGVIAKSASLKTNDTITSSASSFTFLPLRLPEPVHSVAVNAAAKKDDDKLGAALIRAAEEDLTFRYTFNAETKEAVISGMGELHVNIILDKIRASHKMEVETRVPRVPYRETITKKATAEYTHKKQSGGHGQFGRVTIEILPLPRGEQYKFNNKIFGGAVSKGYIPGIEKGIHDAMERGVMAQYPVVDVEVSLLDGKEHPVDSNELSFRLAARNAFRDAMKHAAPALLEPITNLTVFVEDKYLGDVMSDLSGKRGKILGQDTVGGIGEIRAQVPQSELLRYSIDLRSITSGTGSFSVEFDHYAPISGKIADEVIKAAAAFHVHEEED
ncbi:MAG: elongation factor G [Treponema sp.]|jgi:elongation factor G|nr:elongation factor G [Treponema sp.]